jgi:hypothetical protein
MKRLISPPPGFQIVEIQFKNTLLVCISLGEKSPAAKPGPCPKLHRHIVQWSGSIISFCIGQFSGNITGFPISMDIVIPGV